MTQLNPTEPGQGGYVDYVPSAPYQPMYPQLNKNKAMNQNGDIINDENQQEDNEVYEMCEGIVSMDEINCIQLQPEGAIISPKISTGNSIPSFVPRAPNNNNKNVNINEMTKKLHDSIGFFKSKQKRIDTFSEMIVSTNKQHRQSIKYHYENKYKYSLERTIEKNFKGIMRELLLFLIMSEEEFIVKWIEVAIHKKDINLLTLIICTQTNESLQKVSKIYDERNKKTLHCRINELTSNIFHKKNINKFLLKLLKDKRMSEDNDIDMKMVEIDVNRLLNASKSKKKLNKDAYIDIFTQRSLLHLYFVAEQFGERKCSLIDTVKSLYKESSQTGYGITVILYFATRKYDLFADCLAQSMHEPGPNYVMFLRVIVERSEIDLSNVIQLYGTNALQNFIELDLKVKDVNAARIVSKLCGF